MNVRNFIIGISTSVLLAGSINAETYSYKNSEGYYFEVFSGATTIEDIDFGATAELIPGLTLDASGVFGYDVGYTVGGRIGAPIFPKDLPFLGNFRGEVEGAYSEINYDDIDGTITLTAGGNSINLTGGSAPIDGDIELIDIYLNFIYDGEPIYKHIAPFFGLGIGMTHGEEEIKTIGHAGDQLSVNSKELFTDTGIQLLIGANLINFGNNFSSGFRLVGRHLYSGEDNDTDDALALSSQIHLNYRF